MIQSAILAMPIAKPKKKARLKLAKNQQIVRQIARDFARNSLFSSSEEQPPATCYYEYWHKSG